MLVFRGGCDGCDNEKERSSCDLMDVGASSGTRRVRV